MQGDAMTTCLKYRTRAYVEKHEQLRREMEAALRADDGESGGVDGHAVLLNTGSAPGGTRAPLNRPAGIKPGPLSPLSAPWWVQ